jgi:hypothetical protein
MEQLFETAVALAEQGRTTKSGIPKPLDLALSTREFADQVGEMVDGDIFHRLVGASARGRLNARSLWLSSRAV